MQIQDNSNLYQRKNLERGDDRMRHDIFPVEVLSVDYERKVLTVQDFRDGLVYHEVTTFPANVSSIEEIDINMPEQGAIGLACTYAFSGGFRVTAIISWLHSQTYKSVDAIASRPISGERIQGWSDRRRGSYRKAYPGQRTSSYTGGFSERIDSAWDQQSADYSRDKLDADRRQRTQITGRNVEYSDAGVAYRGSITRPTASNIVPVLLPDGTQQSISYLQPGSQPSDRYISGQQDVIPFAEHTELVQEFSLDYPVPFEVLQTSLLDTILGVTADPWARTTVTSVSGQVSFDSLTFMVQQQVDHPDNTLVNPVGPTTNEGTTPQRRGYILEKAAGTLVGYNLFDQVTYGQVLKPQLFIGTPQQPTLGKFGSSVESGYMPVIDSVDHEEARLAASCLSIRFPYEQNTTRLNVTKEGLVQMEVGSTLPKENIKLQGNYEYPYGAGRSLEAHLVGSAKLVVGKNRDEEEAVDAQILGQVVLRLGSDDTSVPNARRTVATQIRSQADAVSNRVMQYWTSQNVALTPGDAVSLTNKKGAESISLRGAFDGGTVIRLGAKSPLSKRRHLVNGYSDGQGKTAYGVGDASRIDSKSYRTDYGAGDNIYRFHDLTQAGASILPSFPAPYVWSGSPVTSSSIPTSPVDSHGQSFDLHAVRDVLLRLGANPDSGQSLLIDSAGGIVLSLGKDKQGRSITGTLDGAIEITIRPNTGQRAIQLQVIGDIDVTHQGNLNWLSTGDWITEQTSWRNITKTDRVFTQQKAISSSLTRDTTEAPDIIHNQGLYDSDENS